MPPETTCPTSSGPYRCSRPASHTGECVCRAPEHVGVGPACTPTDVARAVEALTGVHARHLGELRGQLRRAETRAANAEVAASLPRVGRPEAFAGGQAVADGPRALPGEIGSQNLTGSAIRGASHG